MQQTSNNKAQNRRKPSSNKRLANGSGSKDIPKKWGQDLVGCRVKVWWPLDKMYYEGAVCSYDPVDCKHKVLYADGDDEVLDLHCEKWQMLDEISPKQQQAQVADLPNPKKAPAKRPKQKGKRKLEASVKQEDKSNLRKRRPPADSSKTLDVICNADSQKNAPVSTPADSSKTADVICIADNQKNYPVLALAYSSRTADVICNADDQKNTPVSTPGTSCGPKVTEKEIDDMANNGDPKLNEDLQEKKPSESSELTQRLENTDNIVC